SSVTTTTFDGRSGVGVSAPLTSAAASATTQAKRRQTVCAFIARSPRDATVAERPSRGLWRNIAGHPSVRPSGSSQDCRPVSLGSGILWPCRTPFRKSRATPLRLGNRQHREWRRTRSRCPLELRRTALGRESFRRRPPRDGRVHYPTNSCPRLSGSTG